MQQWMFAVDYKSVRFGGIGGSIYQLSLIFNAHTFGKRLRARGSHGLVTLLCSRVMLTGRAVAKLHKESSSGEHCLAHSPASPSHVPVKAAQSPTVCEYVLFLSFFVFFFCRGGVLFLWKKRAMIKSFSENQRARQPVYSWRKINLTFESKMYSNNYELYAIDVILR